MGVAVMGVAAMAVAANILVEVAVNTLVAVLTLAEAKLLTPERISGVARTLAYRTAR